MIWRSSCLSVIEESHVSSPKVRSGHRVRPGGPEKGCVRRSPGHRHATAASTGVWIEDCEFASKQVECQITFDGQAAQPASELMEHEPRRDVGGVNGAACGAGTGLSFGGLEERR